MLVPYAGNLFLHKDFCSCIVEMYRNDLQFCFWYNALVPVLLSVVFVFVLSFWCTTDQVQLTSAEPEFSAAFR